MKVIFLDFDGVLNSRRYIESRGEYGVIIDPSRMWLLKQIVDETKAKIVLSTSWREHWAKTPDKSTDTGRQINAIFSNFGLEIFDKTPSVCLCREEEIKSWLDEHEETKNFVVLDDMFLSADFLEGHFIRTSNYFDGLDGEDVRAAIEILNNGGKEW